jgi:adenylate cyclase
MKTSILKTAGSTSLSKLEQRLHLADFLLKLSNQMSAFGNLDDVLNAFVEIATRELNAERGTIFLNDPTTNELYSRVAQGHLRHEIRILNSSGIAGSVFTTQESLIVLDPYADPRFNQTIDEQTGFETRSILCVAIRAGNGEVIGVAQLLNKLKGRFTKVDLTLLEKMTTQASLALQNAQFIESMQAIRAKEVEFLNVISEVTSDINISSLLKKVMSEITRMLNADRSTLFLNDEKTGQLWSEVGQGLDSLQIRLPNHLGIAGAVFTSGKVINIPHAYADLRFNPAFDKKTGYFTRSLLCVPITNKEGKVIGVTQVLNKHGAPFNQEDESRLKAFSSEISIALQNAKLFADVQSMKNYNESMLESMSSGVLTLDETEQIVTCNAAGLRILQTTPAEIVQKPFSQIFYDANAWVLEKVKRVMHTGEADITVDAEIEVAEQTVSVNLTIVPLTGADHNRLG